MLAWRHSEHEPHLEFLPELELQELLLLELQELLLLFDVRPRPLLPLPLQSVPYVYFAQVVLSFGPKCPLESYG